MTTSAYMTGRKKYGRPQAMLWSENSGKLINGLYVPNGLEINADPGSELDPANIDQFLILSDDNRSHSSINHSFFFLNTIISKIYRRSIII